MRLLAFLSAVAFSVTGFAQFPASTSQSWGDGLLRSKRVMDELKITDAQKKKFEEIRLNQTKATREHSDKYRDSWEKARKMEPDERKKYEKARSDGYRKIFADGRKAKIEALTKSQQKRLRELTLQVYGRQALLFADVAEELKLKDEQKKAIRAFQPRSWKELTKIWKDKREKKITDEEAKDLEAGLREKLMKEIEKEVLTGTQRAKWKRLRGKPAGVSFATLFSKANPEFGRRPQINRNLPRYPFPRRAMALKYYMPILARNKIVRKELGVTEKQVAEGDEKSKALDKQRDEMMKNSRDIFQKLAKLPKDERAKAMKARTDKYREIYNKKQNVPLEILTKDQKKRLRELAIRLQNRAGYQIEEVVAELKIDEDQIKKLKALDSRERKESQSLYDDIRNNKLTRPEYNDLLSSLHERLAEDARKILNATQKSKYKKLIGKPTDLTREEISPLNRRRVDP